MPDQRLVEVFTDFERTIKEFITRNKVTADEFRKATDVVVASIEAGEGTMIFDTFFEAYAMDMSNDPLGSPNSMAGPFYRPGAPLLERPYVLPQRPDEPGAPLEFRGRVVTTDGTPIAGAELDIWQADANGEYSQFDPSLPKWNLRGRILTGPDGGFSIRTIVPPPYEIPKNGPTGAVLKSLGRHAFRPAHLHVKLRRPGFRELTSQLYFVGDQYLDNDAVGGVRDGLLLDLSTEGDVTIAEYDFVLVTAPLEDHD